MNVRFRIPYFARLRRAGERAFRHGCVTAAVDVVLREASVSELPLAVVVRDDRVSTEYRAANGVLCARARRPSAHASDVAWLLSSAEAPWEPDALRVAGGYQATDPLPREDELGLEVRPCQGRRKGFRGREDAIAEAWATCAGMTLVDGALWTRRADPVLRVFKPSGAPTVHVGEALAFGLRAMWSVDFALTDVDAARLYADRIHPDTRWVADFDLVDASLLSGRDYLAEQAAGYLSTHVEAVRTRPNGAEAFGRVASALASKPLDLAALVAAADDPAEPVSLWVDFGNDFSVAHRALEDARTLRASLEADDLPFLAT